MINGADHSVVLFSIGHSNQSIEAFLELLRQHELQVLIDVRSSPYSKYVPHFNSAFLISALFFKRFKTYSKNREFL